MVIEAVGKRNTFELKSGKNEIRERLFKKEFCNCIGCVISAVVYSNKGCRIWGKPHKYVNGKDKGKNQGDIIEKIASLEVSFHL